MLKNRNCQTITLLYAILHEQFTMDYVADHFIKTVLLECINEIKGIKYTIMLHHAMTVL